MAKYKIMAENNKISVYIKVENVKKLDDLSDNEDLSRSKVLDRMITKHFDLISFIKANPKLTSQQLLNHLEHI